MTILFEASVVSTPDLLSALANYLWYSFAQLNVSAQEFSEFLKATLDCNDEKAISVMDVEQFLMETEDWSRTVPNYRNQVANWERNWSIFKEKRRELKSEIVSRSADQHRMEDFLMRREHVVSALNYIQYARHFGKRVAIVVPGLF